MELGQQEQREEMSIVFGDVARRRPGRGIPDRLDQARNDLLAVFPRIMDRLLRLFPLFGRQIAHDAIEGAVRVIVVVTSVVILEAPCQASTLAGPCRYRWFTATHFRLGGPV